MSVGSLVAALRANRYDVDARAVLCDWCEEHGLPGAAVDLRTPPDELAFARALSALACLFGEAATTRSTGTASRYTVVVALPRTLVRICETAPIEMSVPTEYRLRRIVLHAAPRTDHLGVVQVRVGMRLLIQGLGDDPVPGDLFTATSPDLFDELVPSTAMVSVQVENSSKHEIEVTGCLLGVDLNLVYLTTCDRCGRSEQPSAAIAARLDLRIPWGWHWVGDGDGDGNGSVRCPRCAETGMIETSGASGAFGGGSYG